MTSESEEQPGSSSSPMSYTGRVIAVQPSAYVLQAVRAAHIVA